LRASGRSWITVHTDPFFSTLTAIGGCPLPRALFVSGIFV
jgi:hypothetical protein